MVDCDICARLLAAGTVDDGTEDPIWEPPCGHAYLTCWIGIHCVKRPHTKCLWPPKGARWECTRGFGHDGPCTSIPKGRFNKLIFWLTRDLD